MRNLLLSMLVFGVALAGCGSDKPFNVVGTPQATQLTVSSDVTTIPSDGTSPATITAFARDASNRLLANVPVVFTASSGGISASETRTDESGQITATLIVAGDSRLRTITVTVHSGNLTHTVTVDVVAPAPKISHTLESAAAAVDCASGDSLEATGIAAEKLVAIDRTPVLAPAPGLVPQPASSTVTYSFLVQDPNGNALPGGTQVEFEVLGTGLSLSGPNSFAVACSADPSVYSVTVDAAETALDGVLAVRAVTPQKVESVATYPIDIQ